MKKITDKMRLKWIEDNYLWSRLCWGLSTSYNNGKTLRQAIDAAIRESNNTASKRKGLK